MVGANYQLAYQLYPYQRPDALKGALDGAVDDAPEQYPVIIIGAGPVGLTLALDLAKKGTKVLLLDDHEGVGLGSRAICFAKRTLEIADRLGTGDAALDKGVVWNIGKVFHEDRQLFTFNLLPEDGHHMPAFINLQQPYFEKYLVDEIYRAKAHGAPIEIRGRNVATDLTQDDDKATVTITTPDGTYQALADYVVACDGARSPTRDRMGLGFDGRVFEDNFLIADVKMKADFPTERWFWFEPSFEGGGQSALLHKQPDDIWRLDFQLGADIDRDKELQPERIRARVDGMLSSQTGQVPDYELHWTSIYVFQCRRMEKFRHGRVLFAGDAAHQVSPFGARGANSGIQDADNLAWKLHAVISGTAPDRLLDSYDDERGLAADENILNSTRSTDFLTPKSKVSHDFRNAVLQLAQIQPFARSLINSGRLSLPSIYQGSALNGPDELDGPARTKVGAPCPDAPLSNGFLLQHLTGDFTLLTLSLGQQFLQYADLDIEHIHVDLSKDDPKGCLKARYLGDADQAIYLIRPDQHVAARWKTATMNDIQSALKTCLQLTGHEPELMETHDGAQA